MYDNRSFVLDDSFLDISTVDDEQTNYFSYGAQQ